MRARLVAIAALSCLLAGPALAQSENARLLEKQCSAGKIASCTNLAVLYKNGRSVRRDTVRALTLFLKSCEKGVNYACGNVGEMTYLGLGIKANPRNGEVLVKGACRRGDAWSCETARRYGFKMTKRAPA